MRLAGGFDVMQKVTVADSSILSLHEKGEAATCTIKHLMVGKTMDPKHKAHTLGFSGVSVNTYRKEHGKWLMSSMSWKTQTMTMDGKPMSAPAGG